MDWDKEEYNQDNEKQQNQSNCQFELKNTYILYNPKAKNENLQVEKENFGLVWLKFKQGQKTRAEGKGWLHASSERLDSGG